MHSKEKWSIEILVKSEKNPTCTLSSQFYCSFSQFWGHFWFFELKKRKKIEKKVKLFYFRFINASAMAIKDKTIATAASMYKRFRLTVCTVCTAVTVTVPRYL
jgi:hypothetical protein